MALKCCKEVVTYTNEEGVDLKWIKENKRERNAVDKKWRLYKRLEIEIE